MLARVVDNPRPLCGVQGGTARLAAARARRRHDRPPHLLPAHGRRRPARVRFRSRVGSKGRFTLVSTEPIELAEPIICRCGLAGRIVAGKWAPLDETSPAIMLEFGRPHSKGRERQGAERRASAELDDSMPRESLCC
jgi:hypothetical protein